MVASWPLDKIQRASAVFSYQRMLYLFAQRTFFVGIFFLFLGIISVQYVFAFLPPTAIGVYLLIYAAAMRFLAPSLALRIGDISGFCVLILNSTILFYEITTTTRLSGQLPHALSGIPFLIIAYGFVHFTYKSTVKSAPPPLPAGDAVQFQTFITALLQSKHRHNAQRITMKVSDSLIIGGLDHRMVILIMNKGQVIDILSPYAFEIKLEKTLESKKECAVKVRTGQQWAAARMDLLSFERYQAWAAEIG